MTASSRRRRHWESPFRTCPSVVASIPISRAVCARRSSRPRDYVWGRGARPIVHHVSWELERSSASLLEGCTAQSRLLRLARVDATDWSGHDPEYASKGSYG